LAKNEVKKTKNTLFLAKTALLLAKKPEKKLKPCLKKLIMLCF